MARRIEARRGGRWLAAGLLLLALLAGAAWGQQGAGEVQVGGRVMFVLSAAFGSFTADERAAIVDQRLQRVLDDPALDPREIAAGTTADGTPAVILGGRVLVEVLAGDAAAYDRLPAALAERWARTLRVELTQFKPLYQRQRAQPPARSLGEHRVLLLLLQMALLLLAAHACGEAMRWLGQAPVIGQLLAGILLGPSVFGALFPQAQALIFPASQTQGYLLEVISWLGVLFLLLLTGLETDLALIRSQGRPALLAAVGGVVIPFGGGFAAGMLLPAGLLIDPAQRVLFALFMGTALSVSSVPVIAKILMEMRLLRRTVGQVTLAAAIAHDTAGWIILAALAAAAGGGGFAPMVLVRAIGGTLLFALLLFTLGRRLVARLLRWTHQQARGEEMALAVVTVLMLAGAVATQSLGVHAVLGAFLVGVLLSRSPLVGERVVRSIEGMTMGVFAPIFFGAAGLNVDLSVLGRPALLAATLAVTATACVTKIAGCYLGARRGGTAPWEALSVGLGTNARGAMGLIVAILGFSLGLLTVSMFSILVMMALLTTAMTPPLLRWALGHVAPTAEEQTRLAREAVQAENPLSRVRRVLLPSRGGPHAGLAARLLASAELPHPIELTALFVETADAAAAEARPLEALRAELAAEPVTLVPRRVRASEPAAAILEEAAKGYDLVVLGCGADAAAPGQILGRLPDQIAQGAPCPVLAVRAPRRPEGWRLRRILVPITGEGHTVSAAALTIALARGNGADVTALYVTETAAPPELSWRPQAHAGAHEADTAFLEQMAALGALFDVPVKIEVTRGRHAGAEIARAAARTGADLIFMGASGRPARRLFLGETTAHVLRHAACAVAVLRQ